MTDASSLDEIWIEDEQLSDLLKVLPHMTITGAGARRLAHVGADAPEADAGPFLRALKRIEGSFLIDDGETLLCRPRASIRSDSDRLDDAFTRLVELMAYALRTRSSP